MSRTPTTHAQLRSTWSRLPPVPRARCWQASRARKTEAARQLNNATARAAGTRHANKHRPAQLSDLAVVLVTSYLKKKRKRTPNMTSAQEESYLEGLLKKIRPAITQPSLCVPIYRAKAAYFRRHAGAAAWEAPN